MKYSETDMTDLIGAIETQFANHLAKAEKNTASLAKSENDSVSNGAQESASVDSGDYDQEDIAAMNQMYGSMSKSEAQIHLDSLKKILNVENVIEKSEDSEENDNDLMKAEIEGVKAENSALKKSLERLTTGLTQFVKKSQGAPKQKAITQIEYVKKSEDEVVASSKEKEDVAKLDKSEISKRLSAKIRSGSLEKAEREKITQFYDDGQTNIDSIKHLL